nr:NosD domain-containing protein [Candidatus Sigynarchaeota archaeon]
MIAAFASDNTILNSIIMKNGYGILVQYNSNNATLQSNTVAFNKAGGILIDGKNDHRIIGNNVSFNSGIGIRIGSGSQGCNIYLNVIVDNAIAEAYSSSPTNNAWDNGTIGNFWGDYKTRYPGANRTGNIWNIPYEINGTPGVFDRYPFYRNAVPRADFTVDRQVVLVGKPVTFSFTGAIGDAPCSFQWSFGDGTPNSTTSNPVHAFPIQQDFTVTLTITDRDDDISVRRLIIHVLSASGDYDGDGLSNHDELEIYGTNPMLKDTDGDGFSDGDEVSWKTDPLNVSDNPVTRWVLLPSIISVLALLIGIGIARARPKKQIPILTTREGGHELFLQSPPRTPEEEEAQRRLVEKQLMLSRIISPKTQSEISAGNAAQDMVEAEGMKAKKIKAGPGVDEHVEHKIDEKLEAELNVQVKEELCIVWGTSLKGTSYVCPFCKTKYCIRCAIMLS